MSDVHRWDCDCEFHNPDWTADKISVVRASDFDALRAERDRLVRAAFREGWEDGHAARESAAAWEPTWTEREGWDASDARAAIEPKEPT